MGPICHQTTKLGRHERDVRLNNNEVKTNRPFSLITRLDWWSFYLKIDQETDFFFFTASCSAFFKRLRHRLPLQHLKVTEIIFAQTNIYSHFFSYSSHFLAVHSSVICQQQKSLPSDSLFFTDCSFNHKNIFLFTVLKCFTAQIMISVLTFCTLHEYKDSSSTVSTFPDEFKLLLHYVFILSLAAHNDTHMLKMASTACHISRTLSSLPESFKLWSKKKTITTHKTSFSVVHLCVRVCSDGGLYGAICEMNQCASWFSMVRLGKANGEKQLLLTLRSRLQILSMFKILSLCGESK